MPPRRRPSFATTPWASWRYRSCSRSCVPTTPRRSTWSRRSEWSAWERGAPTASSTSSTALLHRERAHHAGGLVAIDGAVVLVLPGLQGHGDLRGLALADGV